MKQTISTSFIALGFVMTALVAMTSLSHAEEKMQNCSAGCKCAEVAAADQAQKTAPMTGMDHGMMDHSKMPGMAGMADMPGMSGNAAPAASGDKVNAYAEAMAKMHKDMMVETTGDADIDFVRGMIPHHQGAIDMARVLVAKGKDPELKKLGTAIIDAHQKEIIFMKQWLAKHDTAAVKDPAPAKP